MRKRQINKNGIAFITAVSLLMVFIGTCYSFQENHQETIVFKKIAETDINVLGNFLDIEEDYAYISTQEGLIVFDISDPENPERTGSLNFGSGFNLDVEGSFAYILSGGVTVVDIGSPGNYSVVKRYNTNYSNIKIRGSYIFSTVLKKGFEIIDFSNVSSPEIVGRFYGEGSYSEEWLGYLKFDFSGDYMYLGEADQCIKVLDISDISNPSKINSIPASNSITDIVVHGSILAVGTSNELILYDISNPESPERKASLSGYQSSHINTDGSILLFYDDNKTYHYVAVDISNPQSPEVISSYDPSYSHGMILKGDYLYSISNGLRKLTIFKINY